MSGHARRHSAVNCAKMAEPIEMAFGLRTRVGLRKQYQVGCTLHTGARRRIPLNRPCAAAMRPFLSSSDDNAVYVIYFQFSGDVMFSHNGVYRDIAFSALTLLVGRQEGHSARKNMG